MSAIISECGQYRYVLKRPAQQMWPGQSTALFLMLNPSTADAELDDPTIRRCRGFAKSWDCAGIVVANLYALRATNPDDLWVHLDPVGPENDSRLWHLARDFREVVCAWGVNAKPERVTKVMELFSDAGAKTWCLGTTKNGSPRHPLYVRGDQPLIEWKMP